MVCEIWYTTSCICIICMCSSAAIGFVEYKINAIVMHGKLAILTNI